MIREARKRFLVVGAGFSGAVVARELVDHTDATVRVIDERNHIAGNCYTERDAGTGVMVHQYGPHIFNTNRPDVWRYLQRFGNFHPYINRVKARIERGVFSLPINLHTINQFFGKAFGPDEARAFVATLGNKKIRKAANFEEQALKMMGRDLYFAFFYGYTKKQWGCEPRELPASILKRLPIRFSYNDSYYDATFQAMPVDGYTSVIDAMLRHPRIHISLGEPFSDIHRESVSHVFYTGPIDRYFNYKHGRLSYRTVYFSTLRAEGDQQGNAVINYPEITVPHTRVHEHAHFAPWEKHRRSTVLTEYSKETGTADAPYYPKRMMSDLELFSRLKAEAERLTSVSFLGRLGTYRYLNMDQVIAEAFEFAHEVIAGLRNRVRLPVFPRSCREVSRLEIS